MDTATIDVMQPARSTEPAGTDAAPRIVWPDGKAFAFTVFDDTDIQTLVNAPPVYELLHDLGFRTTKSVWPLPGTKAPLVGGATCDDPRYLNWVLSLQQRGFEIGMHNATFHTSDREETLRGIARFQELFGHDPTTMANHTGCREAMYWGVARLSGIHRMAYRVLNGRRQTDQYEGHVAQSPLFWGDVCKSRIKYVRNFVFGDIDTLRACPCMPYHDPERPFVNYWFASSEGPNLTSFVRTISEANQDRLEDNGGACIMYTHFGKSFFRDGKLNPQFSSLMERLSRKNGWFVPVGTLLDYLLDIKGHHDITASERSRLERNWLWHKIRVGGCS